MKISDLMTDKAKESFRTFDIRKLLLAFLLLLLAKSPMLLARASHHLRPHTQQEKVRVF